VPTSIGLISAIVKEHNVFRVSPFMTDGSDGVVNYFNNGDMHMSNSSQLGDS